MDEKELFERASDKYYAALQKHLTSSAKKNNRHLEVSMEITQCMSEDT